MHRLIYRCLRLIFTAENFILRHFTSVGQGVLACLLITAIMGMAMTQSFYFVTFSFAICLLGISFISRHLIHAPLEITRVVPPYGTVREPLQYRILVRNSSTVEQVGLTLLEAAAIVFPRFEEFESVMGTRQNGWQKFKAWQALLLSKQWAREWPMNLPPLPIDEEIEITAKLTPLKRGYLPLKTVTIAVAEPLGLMNKVMVRSQPQSILILPKLYQLPEIQFSQRGKSRAGIDIYDSRIGDSTDFLSLRDYRFGDPLRKIHWKSWAKTGTPIVQETKNEISRRYAIILDAYQFDTDGLIFEQVISVAASVCCSCQSENIFLDLVWLTTNGVQHFRGQGINQLDSILTILSTLEPCQSYSFEPINQYVQPLFPDWDACVCIVSNGGEDRSNLMTFLYDWNNPSKFLAITSHKDLEKFELTPPTSLLRIHLLRSHALQEDLMKL